MSEFSFGPLPQDRNQWDRIEIKLEELEEKVDRMEQKLDSVLKLLNSMNKDTESMGKHVEFVEGVYEQVKRPFHFVMGAVDRMSRARLVQDEPERIAASAVAL